MTYRYGSILLIMTFVCCPVHSDDRVLRNDRVIHEIHEQQVRDEKALSTGRLRQGEYQITTVDEKGGASTLYSTVLHVSILNGQGEISFGEQTDVRYPVAVSGEEIVVIRTPPLSREQWTAVTLYHAHATKIDDGGYGSRFEGAFTDSTSAGTRTGYVVIERKG